MDVIALWAFLKELGEESPDPELLPQPDDEDEVWGVDLKINRLGDRPATEFEPDITPAWIEEDDVGELPEGLRPGVIIGPRRDGDLPPLGEWESGLHVCAWYQQVTFHGPAFGIFIRQECILQMAEAMAPWVFTPGARQDLGKIDVLIRLAFTKFYLHEQFHHKVESFAIRLAVAERRAIYGPYWRNAYRPSLGMPDQLEESLANADAYHRLDEPRYARVGVRAGLNLVPRVRDYLEAHFAGAPPGYQQALKYLQKSAFEDCQRKLMSVVSQGAYPPPPDWHRWRFATHMLRGMFPLTSDIWIVVAPGSRPLIPTTAMPLSVSTSEVSRLLTRLGYQPVPGEGKGSHQKWKRTSGTGEPVNVPLRHDIAKGTLNSIAKEMGFANGHQLAVACRNWRQSGRT